MSDRVLSKPKGLIVMNRHAYDVAYGPDQRRATDELIEFVGPPQTRESLADNRHLLGEIEVLLSGWGSPRVDEEFLASAPKLKAIFYAAGGIGVWATEAIWKRGITVSTASAANAIPVAEYALGTILLGLKRVFPTAARMRATRARPDNVGLPGNYRRTVGLVSFGMIAQALRSMLRQHDLDVVVHDPFLTAESAAAWGVERVSLAELFRRSHAVSLHAPLIPQTVGMITGDLLTSMPSNAIFINTARGPIVRHGELTDVARKRPDLSFVLDVTDPEPLPPESPLYDLPNVLLTSHLAGSVEQECHRLGQAMIDELRRYISGQPLRWPVALDGSEHTAHRLQTPT